MRGGVAELESEEDGDGERTRVEVGDRERTERVRRVEDDFPASLVAV